MRKPIALGLFVFLAFAASARAQEKSDKIAIFVTGINDAAPVAQSLIGQLNESKPFVAVAQKDDRKLVVLISCMPRKQTEPFVCMYVLHYDGATFKTFLGGGLYFSRSADAVATYFLASIAEDALERLEDTDIENLKQALESCLILTESKCNVPGALQKEFGAKQLTLGMYFLKKRQ